MLGPPSWGGATRKRDRDESADRGLGAQGAGRCQSVEAVARELVGRNIIPDAAGLSGFGQQFSDHLVKLVLRSCDLFASMEECREFAVVAPLGFVGDERVRLQHGFESLVSVAGPVSDLGEIGQVAGDLTFVPGIEDRFDVGEILVQRRPPDPGLLGDLGHRYRPQSVLGYKGRGGIQDRVVYLAAVSFDRLGPQLGHGGEYT